MCKATMTGEEMGVIGGMSAVEASGTLRKGSMRSITDSFNSNAGTAGSRDDASSISGISIDVLLNAMRPARKNMFALAASRQGKVPRKVVAREGGFGQGGAGGEMSSGGGATFHDILISRVKNSIGESSSGTVTPGKKGMQSNRPSSARAGLPPAEETNNSSSHGNSKGKFLRPETAGPRMQGWPSPARVKGGLVHAAARADKFISLLGDKGGSGRKNPGGGGTEDKGVRLKDAMRKVRGVKQLSMLAAPRNLELDSGVRKRVQGTEIFERQKLGQRAGAFEVEGISSLIAGCSSPILSVLGDEQRNRVARDARLCKAPDGSIVLGFDDTWASALVIKEGTLEVR